MAAIDSEHANCFPDKLAVVVAVDQATELHPEDLTNLWRQLISRASGASLLQRFAGCYEATRGTRKLGELTERCGCEIPDSVHVRRSLNVRLRIAKLRSRFSSVE